MPPFTYKNNATIAIGIKEYNWANTPLNHYKDSLPKDYCEDFYAYRIARYILH